MVKRIAVMVLMKAQVVRHADVYPDNFSVITPTALCRYLSATERMTVETGQMRRLVMFLVTSGSSNVTKPEDAYLSDGLATEMMIVATTVMKIRLCAKIRFVTMNIMCLSYIKVIVSIGTIC